MGHLRFYETFKMGLCDKAGALKNILIEIPLLASVTENVLSGQPLYQIYQASLLNQKFSI